MSAEQILLSALYEIACGKVIVTRAQMIDTAANALVVWSEKTSKEYTDFLEKDGEVQLTCLSG